MPSLLIPKIAYGRGGDRKFRGQIVMAFAISRPITNQNCGFGGNGALVSNPMCLPKLLVPIGHIIGVSADKNVPRIAANSIIALVAGQHTSGYLFACKQLIRKAVGWLAQKSSVSVFVAGSGPRPTSPSVGRYHNLHNKAQLTRPALVSTPAFPLFLIGQSHV